MPSSTAAETESHSQSPLRLYRISRAAHTQIFPPPGRLGRFDDPKQEFRVLYTTLERRAAFAESLQYFRRDLRTRVGMQELKYSSVLPETVKLESWAGSRNLLRYRVSRTSRLFDLRGSEEIEQVSTALAADFVRFGATDFDASYLTGPNRLITQSISRWAYESGYDGLLFPSRLGTEWTCCAVFDRIRPRLIDRQPITVGDPDLLAVSAVFMIIVSG